MDKYIVMTSSAKMPISCWGRYGNVAVMCIDPDYPPATIDARSAIIVDYWGRLNIGSTDRCAFAKAEIEAYALAATLNAQWVDHGILHSEVS